MKRNGISVNLKGMNHLENFEPKSIIVRMPNWLGDCVMGTPILTDLRKRYPKAEITAMCQANVAELFEKDPDVDELFRFSRSKGLIHRISERNIVAKLKKGRHDLGILLTNSFSSAWRFKQGGVKNILGFRADMRLMLLDHPISFPENVKEQHLVLTYKEQLKPLGVEISETMPRLYVSDDEIRGAWDFVKRFDIDPSCNILGVNPGAAYGSAKCYPPERFSEVAKNLIDAHPKNVVIFFGDGSHKELTNSICQGLGKRVINLAGQTSIRELLALIKTCDAFLTNDSGPMHIADSLDVPLVALFGSTSPIATGPYRQSQNIIQKKVPCSPCFKRVCPIDFPCMKKISSREVTDAVLGKLSNKLAEKA